MTIEQEILRLLAAAGLGAVIGFERERLDRGAGLRTHALVSTASALVIIVSAYGFMDVVTANHTIVLDPSRIAAQVVSGIGFLGAGTIILRKNAIRGLTTAASVWAVAGIGLAAGLASTSPPPRPPRFCWPSCWRSSPSRAASSPTNASGASPCSPRPDPDRSSPSKSMSTRSTWSYGGWSFCPMRRTN